MRWSWTWTKGEIVILGLFLHRIGPLSSKMPRETSGLTRKKRYFVTISLSREYCRVVATARLLPSSGQMTRTAIQFQCLKDLGLNSNLKFSDLVDGGYTARIVRYMVPTWRMSCIGTGIPRKTKKSASINMAKRVHEVQSTDDGVCLSGMGASASICGWPVSLVRDTYSSWRRLYAAQQTFDRRFGPSQTAGATPADIDCCGLLEQAGTARCGTTTKSRRQATKNRGTPSLRGSYSTEAPAAPADLTHGCNFFTVPCGLAPMPAHPRQCHFLSQRLRS